jgi:hypothetical protein
MEDGQHQFFEKVFPAELEEIKQRRKTVGLDASGLDGLPSAKMGLSGVSLSGGGIRSATFSLGVIEALANEGLFKHVDYLSTVSGGGYIGSCLESVMNDPDKKPEGRKFPFHHELGIEEPSAFRHLRNGSNYLAPRGIINKLRLPMLLLRGLVLNFILFLPLVMLAVEVTELAYELGTHSVFEFNLLPFVVLSAFLFTLITFPLFSRVFRNRLAWKRRDRYDQILTLFFGVSLLLLILLPISLFVGGVAEISWEKFQLATIPELLNPLEPGDYWKWIIPVLLLCAFLFMGRASKLVTKWSGRILLFMVGLIGPTILVLIFIILCLFQLDSPFVEKRFAEILDRGEITTELREDFLKRGIPLSTDAQVMTKEAGRAWIIRDAGKNYRIKAVHEFLRIENLDLWDGKTDFIFFTIWAGLLLFNLFFVDVNVTSPHGFYRDRLSYVFLFRVEKDGTITSNDGQKLSDLNRPSTSAPYHLINVALNIHGSKDPNLRGRNAGFFFFSKRYTGGLRTGYCETSKLENYDNHLDLGTAMAISAAAAAPNTGVATVRSLVFIMTFFNIRLGYWLPNPAVVQKLSGLKRFLLYRGAGPLHLLREALSFLNVRGPHVNISDGGHIENLALYELLRRRCRFIISVDGGADPTHHFGSLVKLIRFAKIDMGVTIKIDLSDLEQDVNGLSRKHWALGTISYGGGETGQLLYIKASLTGDENLYVQDYASQYPLFPHQSTSNQFFNETQFEAYRALGYHSARRGIMEYKQLTEVAEWVSETAQS